MNILAIDPGCEESAWCVYDSVREIPLAFAKQFNQKVLEKIAAAATGADAFGWFIDDIVIEQIAGYGMPVGHEIFETVFWSGRFAQAFWTFNRIERKAVKLHLCGSLRAKDSNIRRALLDRFGPQGTKKEPGVTYGISKDVWSALSVAVTYADLHCKGERKKDEIAKTNSR